MPKRKRSDSDSINRIKKKLKKLEKKLARKRRESSSSDGSTGSQDPQGEPIESEVVEEVTSEIEPDTVVPSSCHMLAGTDGEPLSLPVLQQELLPPPATSTLLPVTVTASTAETEETPVAELDNVALEILGTDPTVSKSCGKDIQNELAIRYAHLTTCGLDKDLRKELLAKYLPPGNCCLIDAPVLNPEIKAAITDVVIKRDKAIFDKQKQTAAAISSVSEVITLMLSKDDKDPVLLRNLMDTGRLLCDTQYNDSITRRHFILAVLNKELKNQIQQTKIDKFLFSEELPDTLKAAKAIQKSGTELKASQSKPVMKKPRPVPPKNGKGPPQGRRPPPQAAPPGTWRTREPAPTKPQRSHSSKASQQPHFNSRR